MGYIMCRFIAMVFKQLSLGMDIERATLGQGGIWEVQFSFKEQQNTAEPEVQARCSSVPAAHYHPKNSKDPPPPPPLAATLKEQTRCQCWNGTLKTLHDKIFEIKRIEKDHFYIFNNVLDSKNLLKNFVLILLPNTQRNVRYLIYYRPDANFCHSTAQDKLLRH